MWLDSRRDSCADRGRVSAQPQSRSRCPSCVTTTCRSLMLCERGLLRERNSARPIFWSCLDQLAKRLRSKQSNMERPTISEDRLSRLGPAIKQALSQQELRKAEREAPRSTPRIGAIRRAHGGWRLSANIAILDEIRRDLAVNRPERFRERQFLRNDCRECRCQLFASLRQATGIGKEWLTLSPQDSLVMRGFRRNRFSSIRVTRRLRSDGLWTGDTISGFRGRCASRGSENITQRKQIEEALREVARCSNKLNESRDWERGSLV